MFTSYSIRSGPLEKFAAHPSCSKVYFYNGQQIVLASNDSDETDYLSLVVDDKGITYSQNEEGVRRPNTKLSYVFGEYPELEYFGWINDKEIVVDDILYVAKP